MSYIKNTSAYIILGALALLGCNATIHKDYGFQASEQDFGKCTMYVKLRGELVKINRSLSAARSPYELLIWFAGKHNKDPIECEVSLHDLSLVNIDTGKIAFSKDTTATSFKRRSSGEYSATFRYKNIELEYADHKLAFTLKSQNQCPLIHDPSPVEVFLHRDYKERKITLWDSLMGI